MTEERFWSKVDKGAPDDCWEWTAYRNKYGYGIFHSPVGTGSHRAAYFYAKGPIPPGLFVLHSCHNPPCVNPHHLRVGTAFDNSQDWMKRGLKPRPRRYRAPPPLPSALSWCAGYTESA